MKKTGILISVTGIVIILLSLGLFLGEIIIPITFYLMSIAGLVMIPLGLSFIAFPLPDMRRKRIAKRALIFSVALIGMGFISIKLELIGARIEIMFGVVSLTFYYGSLAFKNKFEKWKIYARSRRDAFLLSLFDFIGIGSFVLGLLFKLQHWPGALYMGTIGLATLAIGLIAWNQKFKSEVIFRKETEDKLKISLEKIEESHKEISDSINYAKRLQDAILPPINQIKNSFPDSFVLYKPKAVVAGDFYWLEEKNGIVFLAAADCTGHGVPGAIVSVVCSNALNRAVIEMNITDPGKILDKVAELVLETFQKSSEQVKDGMDISLMSWSKNSGGSMCCNFSWSGANNPLWIVRKKELIELKGDKQPVGLHDNRKPFTTHAIELEKEDCIYLFTDGYADQFGGPKGKKYKYKQLRDELIEITGKTMNEQKAIMENKLEKWKGDLEQVDDICIIGIKI